MSKKTRKFDQRAVKLQPESALEAELALHIRAAGLPPPCREYRFTPTRDWRFDFCWPDLMLAIEVQGMRYDGKGRHQDANELAKEYEKLNAAQMLGYRVLLFTGKMIKKGWDEPCNDTPVIAIDIIAEAITTQQSLAELQSRLPL